MPIPPPAQLDALLNYLTLGSALCGAIGSISALGVDFVRRRVRSKAAEYAASNDFKLLRKNLIETHGDLQEFIREYRGDRLQYQSDHLDTCQRLAKLEAKPNG
jgi:hypothetical protein